MMGSSVKAREWEKTLRVKCRLCGGARCKRCSEYAALAKVDSPVKGLHADWVANCVLATMRPSSRLINKYSIAQQFHQLKITAVFNLTLPGEHPYCGDGLGPSGFPYDPEKDLMAQNIQFYNFGWKDMTTPTLSLMMDIVKVIASVLLKGHGRVAVHCHAGHGRTGIAIACALLFLHNIAPEVAIRLVRRDRSGSIQTTGQVQFVHNFHAYLNAASIAFALPNIHDQFTLAETIEHQNRRLHGEDTVNSNLPRVLNFLCVELENAIATSSDVVKIASAFVHHLCIRQEEAWTRTSDFTKEIKSSTSISAIKLRHREFIRHAVNKIEADGDLFQTIKASEATSREVLFSIKVGFNVGVWNWKAASALCPNSSIPAILLLDWLEHLREPLLSSRLVEKLLYVSFMPALLISPLTTTSFGDSGVLHHVRSDNKSPGNFDSINFHFQALHQSPVFAMKSLDRVLSSLRRLKDNLPKIATKNGLFDAICVRSAMALFHLSPSSCSTVSLRRHADCLAQLIDMWHAPKRLAFNQEFLQKFSVHRSSTCRLADQISYNSGIDVTPDSDANIHSLSSLIVQPVSEILGVISVQRSRSPINKVHPGVSNNRSAALAIAYLRPSLWVTSPLRIDSIPTSTSRRDGEAIIDSKAPVLTHFSSQKEIELSLLTPDS